jgi:hypothetical protein
MLASAGEQFAKQTTRILHDLIGYVRASFGRKFADCSEIELEKTQINTRNSMVGAVGIEPTTSPV